MRCALVDAEALAQRVEVVALARELLARQRQRVDQLQRTRRRTRQRSHSVELVVEERDVERRVVDDPLGAAREVEELGREVAEPRPALQVVPRHAVHFGRADVDLALGIEVEVHVAPGRPPVDELERRRAR